MEQEREQKGRGPEAMELESPHCYVALTYDHLNVQSVLDRVSSPQAGANVLFAGTTRDTFQDKSVKTLRYQAYGTLALETLMGIAKSIVEKHSLVSIAIIHRLGPVPISEQSILIAVSSAHRQAAWRGGEEALELVKEKAEIWKLEEFEGEDGVWRANRDGAVGTKVSAPEGEQSNAEQDAEVPNFGPVIRPRRPGERGHGAVVNFRQQ